MQYTILLNRTDNFREVEAQERNRFVKSILEALEVPIEFDPDSDLSPLQKQQLIQDLNRFNLKLILSVDGGMKVYVDQDLIGEWHKATYKLKQDYSEVNPKKKFYLEMLVSFKSVFEEEVTGT